MAPKPHFIATTGKDEGEVIFDGAFGAVLKVPSSATGGSLAIVEHSLAPGYIGAPPHRHEREDESSYVLEGELTVQIGDECVTVGPGSWVIKPRGRFHTFWNAGAEPVRFIEVITPGGFEDYFAELATFLRSDARPDMGAISALATRYGLEFDLSALPAILEANNVRLPA